MAETAPSMEQEEQPKTLVELWGKVLYQRPEQVGETDNDTIAKLAKERKAEYESEEEGERALRQDIIDNGGEEELRLFDESNVRAEADRIKHYRRQRRESDPDQMSASTGYEAEAPRHN